MNGILSKFGRNFRKTFGRVQNFCSEASESDIQCKKGVVLGFHTSENGEQILTKAATKIDESIGGKLQKFLKTAGPTFGRGNVRVFNNLDSNFWSIALVGIGPENAGVNEMECLDEGRENVRIAAGLGAREMSNQGCNIVCVDGMGYPEQAAEGSGLAVWKYQDKKLEELQKSIPTVELLGSSDDVDSFQRGLFKAESQNMVRTLCDMPANRLTPLHFSQKMIDELCPCGIKVDVHDKDWIEMNKMHAFAVVAAGSCSPPLFVELNYCGGPSEEKPILLVGKGLTYDTGGICLKACQHMSRHRGDMAGAAIVMAAIRAAAAFNLPINVTGLIPLCENMPSGMAMKCGDVVSCSNGKHIQIESTDNEGRLCIADAIVYGQQKYKPKLIVDISTESKGVTAALGSAAAGVFSNSHCCWEELRKAGCITGDRVWRLPLWKYHAQCVTFKETVDVTNRGIGMGDVCLAAAFINEFVNCVDWMHIDINGVGMKSHDLVYPYLTKGRMTGRPTRTIIQFLYQLACASTSSSK